MLMLFNLIYVFFKAVGIIAAALSIYHLGISLFGTYRKNRGRRHEPNKSFAVLIAAHNEAAVVGNVVKSVHEMNYPKELFDVFVIADNCTDNTAAIARDAGAKVHVRENRQEKGKGYALDWFFDRLFKLDRDYDAVVVLDADNLVSRNFLFEMNDHLMRGYHAVQGYLDSKNPFDTAITASYSLEFWISNRMLKLSRHNLGLSSQISGTGFAVDTMILRKYGWKANCLVEDLEFTCKLILNGYKVGWAHDAVIYDEKPLTLKQSIAQRRRWMQGYADVFSRYFLQLMKKAIKDKDLAAFDCALYSAQPYYLILIGLNLVNMYVLNIGVAYAKAAEMYLDFRSGTVGPIMWLLIIYAIIQTAYFPYLMYLDGKLSLKSILSFIVFPFYSLTWIPVAILGIIHKDSKEWVHTKHVRSLDLKQVEEKIVKRKEML
jgi:cellulose synthase/poly-beta-1,6-N-acetylglucosamine synthase-like glycosyltransferase